MAKLREQSKNTQIKPMIQPEIEVKPVKQL